jgi:hypothetical protein
MQRAFLTIALLNLSVIATLILFARSVLALVLGNGDASGKLVIGGSATALTAAGVGTYAARSAKKIREEFLDEMKK